MTILDTVSKSCRALAVAGIVGAAGIPATPAVAQAGPVNSIVVQAFDAQNGQPIDLHALSSGLYNNASVRLIAHAYDSAGNAVPCAPTFQGNNLFFNRAPADGSTLMTAGTAFGSTQFTATCNGVTSQPIFTSVMAKGTNLGTAQAGLGLRRGPPPTANAPGGAALPGATAKASGHAGVLIGVIGGAVLAGGALAYGLSASGSSGSSYGSGSGSSCPSYSSCCPGGSGSGGCFVGTNTSYPGCGCPSPSRTGGTCGSGCPGPPGSTNCNC